jgi:photosystem II stability/assembly factor-like uncharacterized protein
MLATHLRTTAVALLAGSAAGAASWAAVDSPTFEHNSVCLQVAFDAAGRVGFAGGGSHDGCPAHIQKTTDGGVTWEVAWPQGNCSDLDFNLFLSAATRDDTHAVVGGAFFQTWTEDGASFYPALNNFGTPPQDAGVIPGSGQFALVSGKERRVGGNSVDVSDNGVNYTRIPIPDTAVNSSNHLARYGAFPSKDVWYVTAGTFEGSGAATSRNKLSRHFVVDDQTGTIRVRAAPAAAGPNDGDTAAIVKTADGGKTWSLVYKNKPGDNIYPNGIHCASEQHCVACLEGDTARIVVTRDGGQTWKETMHDTDPHSSLMAVHMLTDKEVWVAGGHPAQNFEGRFWHSLDGGDTWTKTAFPGTYIVSLDMQSQSSGFAVALTSQQPAGLKLFKLQ